MGDNVVDGIAAKTLHVLVHHHPLRSGSSMIPTSSRYEGDVLCVSDFADMEANSSLLILRHRLFTFIKGSIVAFPTQSDDVETFKMTLCAAIMTPTARVNILVMLSPHILQIADALLL